MALIDVIYDAVGDDSAYAALPQALAAAAGGRSATWHFFGADGAVEMGSTYFDAAMNAYYIDRGIDRLDVWRTDVVAQARTGRVLCSDDLMSRADFSRSAFFNEFFRKFGDDTGVSLGAVMPTRDGILSFGIQRAVSAASFSDQERANISDALPHLRRMIEVRRRLDAERRTARMAGPLLDRLSAALLVVDAEARVLHGNDAAHGLLSSGDVLTTRDRRLEAMDARQTRELRALVLQAATGTAGRSGALHLDCRGGGPARRAMVTSHIQPDSIRRCLIIVEAPPRPSVRRREALRALYALTAAEGEIMECLARGQSPEAIAELRGVSIQTIQVQMRSLRAKTGASRLAELVALGAGLLSYD
ncbi:helix-turn-helix transcriptional regulator [Brevundimonas sp. GCM10030266]|uniref:helix-turn-helix transcriptional regulator n=1 Tax=Brevundimonas sp. GCM10030266 TaxID=3273386 RepID=UPI00361A159F